MYQRSKRPDELAQTKRFYQEGLQIVDKSLAPNYTDAVKQLEASLSLAEPNSELEASIKIDLARAKINIADQGDLPQTENFVTLKEVALNENYVVRKRARAFFLLAEVFMDHYDERVARETIFTGPVFKDLLTDGNVLLGIARMYELASDGGRGLGSLRAADFYADQLLANSNLTPDQKSDFFAKIPTLLELGERYQMQVESRQLSPSELFDYTRKMGYIYRLRANIYGKLYLLSATAPKTDRDEVTNMYAKALAVLGEEEVVINKQMEMPTRFDYAQWLYEAYGSSSGKEIESVLAPLFAELNKRVMEATVGDFFEIEKDPIHRGHYHQRGILELAQINSQLKNLLVGQYGWLESALNAPLPQLFNYGP